LKKNAPAGQHIGSPAF